MNKSSQKTMLKKYYGLEDTVRNKLLKFLKRNSIITIRQYIESLENSYRKQYYTALVIAVSLFEISLLRLRYFIKRKAGLHPQQARQDNHNVYSELKGNNIASSYWNDAFGNEISNWSSFLKSSIVKDLFNIQNKEKLKQFRNAVTHGKVAALQEKALDKSTIWLCIDCTILMIVGILMSFYGLTSKNLLGDMRTWGIKKTQSPEGRTYKAMSNETREKIQKEIKNVLSNVGNTLN